MDFPAAGIYCKSASPTITNNTITGNTASSYGGGICCYSSSSPTIANNAITGNMASYGGGIYCYDSSSPTIINNTIAGNTASYGGGIYCYPSSSPMITNTIIAFNSAGVYCVSSTATLRYCCVYGNSGYNFSGLTDPTGTNGNLSADPQLADLANGNLHLQPISPCIDAGDDHAIQAGWIDIDGQARKQAAHVDIGADESDGTHWPSAAAILYVSSSGSNSNDGLSWATAKRTVQAAIDAGGTGSHVWVAAGTYVQRITLKVGVAIYGGFVGTETDLFQRNWIANVTILDGNQAGSVVTAPTGATASTRIDGFTIRNGNGSSGGGISCNGSSPTITNNTITGNTASDGGGISCKSSSPTITNNTIAGNTASYGGGISCNGSSPTITNNTIAGNTASYGGGISCNGSSPTITNNTIAGNTASYGGGIYCNGSSPMITNTIIAFNSAGVCCVSSAANLRYCCVYGNGASNYSGLTDPTGTNGNLSADPQLADLANGNLHLQPTSPCIDAGDDSAIQAGWIDIDGQARKQAAHVDIGADESDGTHWPSAAAILYVSPSGSNSNNGLSWATAKQTVQAAIDVGGTGSHVWVAAGTYVGTVQLRFGIALYGGFAGTETDLSQRNWTANVTILDGNQKGSVVTAQTGATAATRIDGFTIRNGNGSSGGGIACNGSSPTITNNTITGNTAYSQGGGGIYCYSSSPTITNNVISGNNAGYYYLGGNGGGISCNGSSPTITSNTIASNTAIYGGGIYCYSSVPTITNNTIIGNTAYSGGGGGISCGGSSSPTITNNTITGNTAYSYGGGICCYSSSSPMIANNTITGNTTYSYGGGISCDDSSSPTITNNTITGNTADGGGGISCYSSSPTITNNTISGNVAGIGGGIYCYSSSPTIANNTITGNDAAGYISDSGGGIYCSSSSPTITNTIIAFNSSGIYRGGGTPTLRYCCVYGNSGYNFSGLTDPTGTNGNLSADPQLADLANGNLHLQPTSPCIDAGDDSAIQAGWIDIDGQARKQAAHVDIGADESDGTHWPSAAAILYVSSSGSNSNDGLSWATAKRTVQAAIDAGGTGSHVWVAAGTYVGTIQLRFGIALYGGFAGTETDLSQRNWRTNLTILDGNQADSVVTAPTGATASTRIDGFTIRSGRASFGGGISCNGSSPTITNNTIVGNTASNGGGIYCYSSSPTITNNSINGNAAGSYGGGIYCYSSSPTITNNTIAVNTASDGGGICCSSSSSPMITNTIIAFNSSGIYRTGGTPTLRYCCVYGNSGYNFSGLTDPTGTNGNLSADPQLADLANGNLHLQPISPCIDAGDDRAIQAGWIDIDGQARKQAAHVDIGADESDGTHWPSAAAILYVSSSGSNSNDGLSWATAKRTVQAAIDAGGTGSHVWVAAGTYVGTIQLRFGIALYGGFAGTETDLSQRNWRTNLTILDGNQAGSVVTAQAGATAATRIDGFTIRNGNGSSGGGIFCNGSSPTITNNSINGNAAGSYGGGIYCYFSVPTITNSTISGNTASNGGGMYCAGSSPTITNNTIVGNTASSYGGGICCYSSSTITSNTIASNTAVYGGGIYCYSYSPMITNTLIAFNSSGIYRDGGTLTLRYCCIYGNTAYDYSGLADPTGINGNISADPRQVRAPSAGPDSLWGTTDDDYGDLRLLPGSSCIDAGNNADVPADTGDLNGNGSVSEPLPFDLAGGPRFLDDPATLNNGAGTPPIVDIGAYEYDPGLVGDISGDGHVDIVDLLYLAGAWGSTTGGATYSAACDLNCDGSVDVVDLLYLAHNWGK